MSTNFTCMVCAWRWYVRPENSKSEPFRKCPACGSSDTREDRE